MSRLVRLVLVLSLILTSVGVPLAPQAAAVEHEAAFAVDPLPINEFPGDCEQGQQASGAFYVICMPEGEWNGELVVFAHGYVAFNEPIGIPYDQVCLGDPEICIPDIVNALGYAFAMSGYSDNGLAVLPGMADTLDLVLNVFPDLHGEPTKVYLTGASEGGIITALSIEQYPDVYDGGLAICGPIGDFHFQIAYFGDFRGLFDYFFPGLMPGDPISPPDWLVGGWGDYWRNAIMPVIFNPSNRDKVDRLLEVAKVPYDPENWRATVEESIHDALWYNVFATNDAKKENKLGDNPFGNIYRVYYPDTAPGYPINRGVQRIAAEQIALDRIDASYQTTGQLEIPLVTMHTTLDQQVPFFHEIFYLNKTRDAGSSGRHINIVINRYGHCDFTVAEALIAFIILVIQSNGQAVDMETVQALLPDAKAKAQFSQLMQEYAEPLKLNR